MKQPKTSHGAQDVYDTLSLPSKQVGARKVIITVTREIVVLASADSPVPPEFQIDTEFKSMDELVGRSKTQIDTYHAEFLGCEPPKKQSKETTAFYVWAWWCKNGKPILPGVDAEGNKERKSTIDDSQYFYGTVKDTALIKTPQAKVCYDLFKRCIGDRPMVLEKELRQFVEHHAAELKTKQDPWRIFQYYRPTLIASQHIRRS